MRGWWPGLLMVTLLGGCAGGGGSQPTDQRDTAKGPAATPGGERYAMSGDAYPEDPPDVSQVPDAVPRVEAPSRGGNRPTYEVWGKTYRVLPDARGYAREGTASWYGEKFHGYATSNGEIYDMYKMTAAHRSLPLPTYARVTSLDSGQSVIVRVNDRGPFHNDREIDLSYAAAARLDILDRGTGRVKVEAIDAEQWLAEHGEDAGRSAGSGRRGERVADVAKPASPERAAAPALTSRQPAANGTGAIESRPTDGRPTESRPTEGRPTEGRPIYLQIAALGSADGARALKARLESELSHPVRVASATGMYRVQVGPLADSGQVDPLRDALRRAGFDQAFIVNGAE